MQFIRNLFKAAPSADRALIIYVKPKACQEIIQVRIDTMNELSRDDSEAGFYVRKLARGARCPFQVEIELQLDADKRIVDQTITNGTAATAEEYQAYLATKTH